MPNDIRNKVFEKVKTGYRVEEVQPFLNDIATQIEALTYEKADLQTKLEILAEKLEQYREDEDSLRAALIGAQKLGDSVVRDSKRKAESIIAQATRKSEEMIADAQNSINRETIALNKMQVEVAKFKSHILTLYKKHIELIQELPYDEADIPNLEGPDMQYAPKAPVPNIPVVDDDDDDDLIEQIASLEQESNIPLRFGDNDDPPFTYDKYGKDDDEDVEIEDSDVFPKNNRSSRFGTLRFGDDYAITRRD